MAWTSKPVRRRPAPTARRAAGRARPTGAPSPRPALGKARGGGSARGAGLIGLISVVTAAISAYAAHGALQNQLEQQKRAQAEELVLVEVNGPDFPYVSEADDQQTTSSVPRVQNYSRLPMNFVSISIGYKVFLSAEEGAEPDAVYAAEHLIGSLEPCEQADLSAVMEEAGRSLTLQAPGEPDLTSMELVQIIRYIDAAGNTWYRTDLGRPKEDDRESLAGGYLFHGDEFDNEEVELGEVPISVQPIPGCSPG